MRRVPRFCIVAVCVLVVLGEADRAAAEEPRSQDKPYFAPLLVLGVGGSAEAEAANFSFDDDLEPSFGAGLKYMHPLHRYFALGGQFSMLWWNTEAFDAANLDRSLLMDFAIVPQARLPVTDEIELTLGLPLGLSLDFWGPDGFAFGVAPAPFSSDVGTGFGFNLALMFGARFALSEDVGLITEFGYAFHSVSHSAEVMTLIGGGSGDFDVSLAQPVLQVGVAF